MFFKERDKGYYPPFDGSIYLVRELLPRFERAAVLVVVVVFGRQVSAEKNYEYYYERRDY